MSLDRAELAGTGAALVLHVALVAALSLHLAKVETPPEPPAMEVELVEDVADVALAPAAPQSIATPPAPAQAPEIGEPEPIEPAPAPVVAPGPPPPLTASELSTL